MEKRFDDIQRKTLAFEVKQAELMDGGQYAGEFTGYAAGILNIDSTGDMILPGAFNADIPRFLSDGVVCWQHDWMTPIGVPLEAKEDGYGLLTRSRISRTLANDSSAGVAEPSTTAAGACRCLKRSESSSSASPPPSTPTRVQ